jgi:nitroimidazol reductase NimA-like FMN-containing flavoprotein (pyridoxamine 5'-phosphate oxidase superfamily)
MRRSDKQVTDITVIEEIIACAEVCRIAMCDGNVPYLVPVNFGYRDRAIFIHSPLEGRKIDILKKNNRVCFEVEADVEILKGKAACDWGARYLSVIGTGAACFIEDIPGKKDALDVIMRKYSGTGGHSYDVARVNSISVIRIDIREMSGKKSGMA